MKFWYCHKHPRLHSTPSLTTVLAEVLSALLLLLRICYTWFFDLIDICGGGVLLAVSSLN